MRLPSFPAGSFLFLCLASLTLPASTATPASATAPGGVATSASAAAGAASAGLASLEGSLHTDDGVPVPGVGIELRKDGERRLALTSGPDGRFRASGLPAGDYEATVDAPGFVLAGSAAVQLAPGPSRLDLLLEPAPVSEQVVVSATRNEATLSTLGVAADVLDRERIEERAAPELLSLLQEVPGFSTARAGGTGMQGSAFVRGGEARYARVLIDGVPVNQPGGAYDFGTALPFELERVEVVRGAASSVYGSDALAGVVSLTTRRARGDEAPSARAEAEGGSFAWRRFAGGTSGTRDALDWNAGGQRLLTDNEQPNGGFEQTTLGLSAGLRLGGATDARLVARYDDSSLGTPGPTAFGRPDLDASFERRDASGALSVRRSGTRYTHQLTASYARTRQLSLNPLDSGPFEPQWNGVAAGFELFDYVDPQGFQNQTTRSAVAYQADVALGTRHLLTAGGEAERQRGEIGSRAEPLLEPVRDNFGVYLQDRVLLGRRAYLTLGGRVERNGSSGTTAVPRAALALRVRDGENATTLRASGGMGVKEPSFIESFGNLYTHANPDLDPERSTTFDAGVEQRLAGSRLRLAATAFHHEYRDQIAYTLIDPANWIGRYVNLARTRSKGLELALDARPLPALSLRAQYTLQDGRIVDSPSDFDPVYQSGRRLLRRPRHQGSVSAWYAVRKGGFGATLVRVGRRADSDFLGLGLADDPAFSNPGYTRLDVRAHLRLHAQAEAVLAADNLLDARYQEVLGYPALGRALRAGLRLTIGGRR